MRGYAYSGIAHVNTGALHYMSDVFKQSKMTYNECAGFPAILALPFGVWGISKIYKYGRNFFEKIKIVKMDLLIENYLPAILINLKK